MSCYICERETFIKVIKAWTKYGDIRLSPYDNDEYSIQNLWRDIKQFNYDNYNYRYKEISEEAPAKDIPTFEELSKNYTDAELLGALRCYQYQCSEMPDYHENKCYYWCDWAKNGMLEKYVPDSGEYWG